MRKRGKILRDTSYGPGLLGVDGRQYIFSLEGMWRSEVPPRLGMSVGVIFDQAGAPVGELLGGDAAREMGREMTGMFGPSFAAYGVLLCSI